MSNKAILFKFLKLPQNKECADCTTKNPDWASTNLGVWLCIRCAGLHRQLGTHISKVRSVRLDTWKDIQVEKMKRFVHNDNSRKYYEHGKPEKTVKPDERTGASTVMQYIQQKYVKKAWIPRDGLDYRVEGAKPKPVKPVKKKVRNGNAESRGNQPRKLTPGAELILKRKRERLEREKRERENLGSGQLIDIDTSKPEGYDEPDGFTKKPISPTIIVDEEEEETTKPIRNGRKKRGKRNRGRGRGRGRRKKPSKSANDASVVKGDVGERKLLHLGDEEYESDDGKDTTTTNLTRSLSSSEISKTAKQKVLDLFEDVPTEKKKNKEEALKLAFPINSSHMKKSVSMHSFEEKKDPVEDFLDGWNFTS